MRWDNRNLGGIQVLAHDVRFERRPRNRMTAGTVALRAKVPIETLADWLADADIEFVSANAGRGEISVRYRWRRLSLSATVTPDTTSSDALFKVRALALRGRNVPLPKCFSLALTVDLPVGETVRLRGARLLDDETLSIEAELPLANYPLSVHATLDQLGGSPQDRSPITLDATTGD